VVAWRKVRSDPMTNNLGTDNRGVFEKLPHLAKKVFCKVRAASITSIQSPNGNHSVTAPRICRDRTLFCPFFIPFLVL